MSRSPSRELQNRTFYALAIVTAATFVFEIFFIFLKAPVEVRMGIVQKIFYFHVPSAYAMYLGATACLVGSVVYLARPSDWSDALALAGAEAACVFGFIVLTTGPLWGAKAWGTFWTWDPRLTTLLLSVMIYVAVVVLRAFAGDGDAERKFAAALGVLGTVNLPIIHYSVMKWGGNHPTVIGKGGGGLGHPAMKLTLMVGFVAMTLLAVLLIWLRTRLSLLSASLTEAEEEVMALEYEHEES